MIYKGGTRGFNGDFLDKNDWLERRKKIKKMYCFLFYITRSGLDEWIGKGSGNYINKTREIKSQQSNTSHQNAVNTYERYILSKYCISDMIIGKETVRKRDTTILEQREYTKKVIDGVEYYQVGGIALR